METSVLDTDTALTANSDSKVATQKAVKAYVDAGGNVNASTTTKGIVEEATDAEITAGTATGGTGAKLFVTPPKLNTQIDAKLASYMPCYQQKFATSTKEALTATEWTSGSNASGSVLYIMPNTLGLLYRYERDSMSGMYFETHAIDPTLSVPASDSGAIIVIGIYMYIFSNDGTNIICSRFLASDLTGEQVMTVPTVACTTRVTVWTDGTNAYVQSGNSDTTLRLWTVSGTTFSASSTSTTTTNIYGQSDGSTMSDGTYTYYVSRSTTSTVTIVKNTLIDGTTRSTSTKKLPLLSDVIAGTIIVNIDSTKMYLGYMGDIYDETGAIVSAVYLFPITKP